MNEDFSSLFDKLNINKDSISPEMIGNLMNMLNNSSNNNSESEDSAKTSSSSENTIDFETFIKMKNIMDKMNSQNDPRSNLLRSLKPYLKGNKQNKIDEYIQLLNMSKIIEIFPFGGDKKNDTK